MLKLIIPLIFVLFLSGCIETVDPFDKTKWNLVTDIGLPLEEKEWTFIMYFNGDNNLEYAVYDYINEMEKAGSDENINIVMQMDTLNEYEDLGLTAKRLYINKDTDPSTLGPTVIYDLGEQNMGDPNTLSDFINWSVANFPAKKYALILFNHGLAWKTTSADDTDDDSLELSELTSALEKAKQQTSKEFEIIGFDMCLLGNIDVDYAISPYAKIRVASPDLEIVPGWDYSSIFSFVKDNPDVDGKNLSSKIVETFIPYQKIRGTEHSQIISAVDLKKIGQIKDELKPLVDSFNKDIQNNWKILAKAKFNSDKYDFSKSLGLTDLHSFLSSLKVFTNETNVLNEVNKTLKSVEDSVLYTSSGGQHEKSLGLSFVFQEISEYYALFEDEYKEKSAFARETGLTNLLDRYHEQQSMYLSNISTSILKQDYTINKDNPIVYIPTNFYGENIVHKYMWVGKDMGDYYDILFISDLVDPNSSEYRIRTYEKGDNIQDEEWDGRIRGVSNGIKEIYAFSEPLDVINDLFFAHGTYSNQEESYDADILFDISNGGKMTDLWAYESFADNSLPFYPVIKSGNTFTFKGLKFFKDGDVESYKTKNSIEFTDQGLKRTLVNAPNGEYVLFFVVEDIVGKRSYDFVNVTVDL